MSMLEEDQLLESTNDSGLKSALETTSNLYLVWIKVKVGYPEIATDALKSRLLVPGSYLCEAQSSAVTAARMSLWSRLDTNNTL